MRLRRIGDAGTTKTPGPKPSKVDRIEELARAMIPGHSRPRTLARSRRAATLLDALGLEFANDHIATLTGSREVNVSRLLRLAENEALRRFVEGHRLDSQKFPDLLDNPDYRQVRAAFLRGILEHLRANQKK
jgi:hypothetical protein